MPEQSRARGRALHPIRMKGVSIVQRAHSRCEKLTPCAEESRRTWFRSSPRVASIKLYRVSLRRRASIPTRISELNSSKLEGSGVVFFAPSVQIATRVVVDYHPLLRAAVEDVVLDRGKRSAQGTGIEKEERERRADHGSERLGSKISRVPFKFTTPPLSTNI